jgi:hypothetical protein
MRPQVVIHGRAYIHSFAEGVSRFRVSVIVEAIPAALRQSPYRCVCMSSSPPQSSAPSCTPHRGDASYVPRQPIHLSILSAPLVPLSKENSSCVRHCESRDELSMEVWGFCLQETRDNDILAA